ncbi:fumarate hydratase C-terminal domain-containing protein [Vibrio lentus]|nr:fumarate hydratase C-terminal domain-containing protein [Vibrio lentus]
MKLLKKTFKSKTGETVLLSGKILTGRDAAHKRIQGMLGKW